MERKPRPTFVIEDTDGFKAHNVMVDGWMFAPIEANDPLEDRQIGLPSSGLRDLLVEALASVPDADDALATVLGIIDGIPRAWDGAPLATVLLSDGFIEFDHARDALDDRTLLLALGLDPREHAVKLVTGAIVLLDDLGDDVWEVEVQIAASVSRVDREENRIRKMLVDHLPAVGDA